MSTDRIKLEAVTPETLERAGEVPFRIWSAEHGAYWRSGGSGYVACPCAAGLFTLADAYRQTKHCGPEKRIEFERTSPDLASIEADQIVIRVPILAVPFAASVAFDEAYGEHGYSVTDAAEFARAIVGELRAEEEDGTTLVHRMLDKASTRALENGAEGIAEAPRCAS